MMQEAAFERAVLLTGTLAEGQEEMLRFFCGSFTASLTARLRDGIPEEQYQDTIASAAAMLAAAALIRMDAQVLPSEFKAGDLTVKQGGGMDKDAAVRSLEQQARMLAAPYVQDGFCFAGV